MATHFFIVNAAGYIMGIRMAKTAEQALSGWLAEPGHRGLRCYARRVSPQGLREFRRQRAVTGIGFEMALNPDWAMD